jgi:hypothetical protein
MGQVWKALSLGAAKKNNIRSMLFLDSWGNFRQTWKISEKRNFLGIRILGSPKNVEKWIKMVEILQNGKRNVNFYRNNFRDLRNRPKRKTRRKLDMESSSQIEITRKS